MTLTFEEFVAKANKESNAMFSRAGILKTTFGLSKAEALLLASVETFNVVICDNIQTTTFSELKTAEKQKIAYAIYSEGIILRGFFGISEFDKEWATSKAIALEEVYKKYMKQSPGIDAIYNGLLVVDREFKFLLKGIDLNWPVLRFLVSDKLS